MAIFDAFLQLSGSYSGATVTPQDIYATDTSVVSTNSVDVTGGSPTGQVADIFKGEDLDLVVDIITAVSGGTSVEFQIISADNTALTTNVTVLASSGAIAVASLTAGASIRVSCDAQDPRTLRRYVGARFVNVGANSAGAAMAALSPYDYDRPQPYYTSGFTVA